MLILNIFLTIIFINKVKGDCVALTNSTVCSAFSQFYIGIPELAKDFPFLINTTTIEQFDKRLLEYVNSTSAYLFPLGCLSSNFNRYIPYPRYSLSRICAGAIQNSNSLPCNFNNGLIPPPLCKTTCFDWVNSVTQITNDPRVCASSSQRNWTIDYYVEQCSMWQGYNGTVNQNCISGIANEPDNCGFGYSTKRACHYCANNPSDECCQLVSCPHPLRSGAITGIVIGSVVFAAVILSASFFIYKRRRKVINQKANSSTSSSSTAVATQVATKSISEEFETNASLPLKTRSTTRSITRSQALPPPLLMNNLAIPKNPSTSPFSDEFHVVIHPYPPQMADELALNIGDIICLAAQFDDGWALGFNVTSGLKGAFPIVCITPAPKESLDRLLNMDEFASISSEEEPHRNDFNLQLSTENIINNTQKPINFNSYEHDSIRDTIRTMDYSDTESPLSPTMNTPFFDSLRKNPNNL